MRFRLAERAVLDIQSICSHIGIERQAPDAANRQLDILHDKFLLLANHPLLGELREDVFPAIRSFSAGSFVIFYFVDGENIEIAAVVHSARDLTGFSIKKQ